MSRKTSALGVTFEHRGAFWLGTLLVTVGTTMQLPDFFGAKDMHYHLAGMGFSWNMVTGMVLMLIGVGLVIYGLVPGSRRSPRALSRASRSRPSTTRRSPGPTWG